MGPETRSAKLSADSAGSEAPTSGVAANISRWSSETLPASPQLGVAQWAWDGLGRWCEREKTQGFIRFWGHPQNLSTSRRSSNIPQFWELALHILGAHCQVVILYRLGIQISPGINQQEMAIAIGRQFFVRNRAKLPFEDLMGTLGRIVAMDLDFKSAVHGSSWQFQAEISMDFLWSSWFLGSWTAAKWPECHRYCLQSLCLTPIPRWRIGGQGGGL